jgi:energy-coupling factor transporter transmembrane protein EcfT
MELKLSPAIKGLITAVVMVGVFLLIYSTNKDSGSSLQFMVYGIYGGGIIWTLLGYRRSASFTGKLGDLFSQGFKCFVTVTLCMALFYGIFNYMHPEFAAETAQTYKEQMIKDNQKTPPEIESAVATFKKQYTLKLVSGAIFGYLLIGAAITAGLSALLARRKE